MRVWLAVSLLSLIVVASSARADVVYDEANGDPDLSGNYLAPTPIALSYGSNIITLQIQSDEFGYPELDLFRVDLPIGGTLTAVVLTDSLTSSGDSFLAFQAGSQWSFNMDESAGGSTEPCLAQCTGFGHFGGLLEGQNLFNTMITQMEFYQMAYPEVMPFQYPLLEPQYVFWAQELNSTLYQYSFDFVVSTPGDYNGDSAVNAADYTVWRNTLGEAVSSGEGADGDRDEVIDLDDYLVWKAAYGLVISEGAGATVAMGTIVPEPGSLLMCAVAGLLSVGTAHRRQRR
jgi:hypothetical protein